MVVWKYERTSHNYATSTFQYTFDLELEYIWACLFKFLVLQIIIYYFIQNEYILSFIH
jgi:hypothetical protein